MSSLDDTRITLSQNISEKVKSNLGQYFTPCLIAEFMASMFSEQNMTECSILDPGAGIGTLTSSLANKILLNDNHSIKSLTAIEIDHSLINYLVNTTDTIRCDAKEIICADFIETALNWIQFEPTKRFSHIIMNPPYKKIPSSSDHRKLLRCADIETVNLYSGFVALCIFLLAEHGELVAIIPRSFCNGPYYKQFRNIILKNTHISHIHLFTSRKNNFKEDNVLQENVIIKLVREKNDTNVIKISKSTDGSFLDYLEYNISSDKIIKPSDQEHFIRIPEIEGKDMYESSRISTSLETLNLTVSTGPIVDFRVKTYLRATISERTVPLIYSLNMNINGCNWPQLKSPKASSIMNTPETTKMLFPKGYYCAVKRFSSKEEKRRVSSCVIAPEAFQDTDFLGFENHVNVFHWNKQGIEKELAYGLMVFLNSALVDKHFRTFNGHTQVNATDLRQMKYPSREILIKFGAWAITQETLSLNLIDQKVEELLCQ